jgi:hypothetical protein
MYNMGMITAQNVTDDILPAFLHTTILVLRGFNRGDQADFLESLLEATKFGQEKYGDYRLNKPLEKQIKHRLKSAKKSFKKSCKKQRIPHERIDEITTKVDSKLANILEELQLGSTHLRQATTHPEKFQAWLKGQTETNLNHLQHLERTYYAQLIEAITAAYTSHISPELTYSDIGIKYLIEKVDEINVHTNPKRDKETNSPITTVNIQNEIVLYGHFPQLVQYYTERHENNKIESIESNILETIQRNIGQHIVIVGPTGSGKTQLARVITNELTSNNTDEWAMIAWLDARSPQLLRKQLTDLGSCLGLVNTNTTDQDQSALRLLAMIPNILNGRALFVFDNADNINTVSQYLPITERVSVVVTTQSHDGWKNFASWAQYELTEFDENTAIELLLNITGENDQNEARQLVKFAGSLPLTIAQIGATICDDTSLTLNTYLAKQSKRHYKARVKPIHGAPHNETIDRIFINNLITLLDKISANERTVVLQQLCTLCYLAENGCPREWIELMCHDTSVRTYQQLKQYAIISETEDGVLCKVHPYHSEIIRNNWNHLGISIYDACDIAVETLLSTNIELKSCEQYEQTSRVVQDNIEQFLCILNQRHSKPFLRRPEIQMHLSSTMKNAELTSLQSEALGLDAVLNYCIANCSSRTLKARLHAHYANLLRFAGRYRLALSHYARAKGRLRRYHQDHLITELTYRRNEAQCLRMSMQYREAVRLLEHIAPIAIKRLGDSNIHTLLIHCELGYAYYGANNLKDAIQTLQPLCDFDVNSTNYINFTTHLSARNILSMCYVKLGLESTHRKFSDFGIQLLVDTIYRFEEHLPSEHTDCLEYRQNLGSALGKLGMQTLALEQYKSLLDTIINKYGPHHALTFNARHMIGVTELQLGHYENAISTLSELERELETRVSPDSFWYLNCQYALGPAHFMSGHYVDALASFEKIVNAQDSLVPDLKSATRNQLINLSKSVDNQSSLEVASQFRRLADKIALSDVTNQQLHTS